MSTTAAEGSSYRQILRSSALIGAASLIDIALRIVRVKVMAILLGPAGVGLMGLFTSILDLTRSVVGLGLEGSAVRQIARAEASGERERVALTVWVLRRACLALGLVGAGALLAFAPQVSRVTFGSDEQAGAVALVSLAVLLRMLYSGQAALLRGARRIADLARVEVLGALLATASVVPLIYYLREAGIVAALVAMTGAATLGSWWYARKADFPSARPSLPAAGSEARALVELGFAFMVTGLLTMGVAYLVRVLVLKHLGVEAAGHYQSAWTIGGLYVGFILQAMGTDFYPRLTGVVDDAGESNRLVNEQVTVSLLMAGPGVLATLTLAPLVIAMFYSTQFDAAAGPLRWICLGMSLRVVTWPLGFIVVARGLQALFIWIDLACALVQLGLAWLLVQTVGLDGAGMAFFGLYVFHALIIYPIARRLTGFRWSRANVRLGLSSVALIAAVFASIHLLPVVWSTGIGLVATTAAGIASLRSLAHLVSPEGLPAALRRVLGWLRLLPDRGRA